MTYRGLFKYSEGMDSVMQKYGSLSKQYIEAHEHLHQAERDKLQHEANNLWDSN
jgi:hypothetical protein